MKRREHLLSCPTGGADEEDATELLFVRPVAERQSGRYGAIAVIDTGLFRARQYRLSIIANRLLSDPRMVRKSACHLVGGEGERRRER